MDIKMVKIDDIVPYENNPRHNADAIEPVKESIRQFGFRVPMILDKENVIVAGHTRYEAAKALGMTEVPVIYADDLSEEQVRKFRLVDNKTAEFAEWDIEKLQEELSYLDFDDYDFGFGFDDDLQEMEDGENSYSQKTEIPQYEPTGNVVTVEMMVDSEKANGLIAEIEQADGITQEEKDFLIKAAHRHDVFNYKNIADYYSNASAECQSLMEKSGLVIIDIGDAIKNGYAKLMDDLVEIEGRENG